MDDHLTEPVTVQVAKQIAAFWSPFLTPSTQACMAATEFVLDIGLAFCGLKPPSRKGEE